MLSKREQQHLYRFSGVCCKLFLLQCSSLSILSSALVAWSLCSLFFFHFVCLTPNNNGALVGPSMRVVSRVCASFFLASFFFITFSMHEFYCSFRNTSERNIFYIYANFVDWLLCMCYTHTHRTAEYLKRLSLSLALRSLSYSPFATLSHPPSCSCRVFLHSAQNVTEIIRSMGAIPMDINLKRKERNTEAVETKYKIKSRTHYTRAASRIYM